MVIVNARGFVAPVHNFFLKSEWKGGELRNKLAGSKRRFFGLGELRTENLHDGGVRQVGTTGPDAGVVFLHEEREGVGGSGRPVRRRRPRNFVFLGLRLCWGGAVNVPLVPSESRTSRRPLDDPSSLIDLFRAGGGRGRRDRLGSPCRPTWSGGRSSSGTSCSCSRT